jgi:hypothetical protein
VGRQGLTNVRFRLLLVAACCFALGGCAAERVPDPVRLADPTSVSTWGFHPIATETLLVGGAPLRIVGPATFVSAHLDVREGDLELLAARVSLQSCEACRRRPGLVGYRGYAGSSCSVGAWPPPGYGPTYDLHGFEVDAGDRLSVVLYLRPHSSRAKTDGVTVTYRDRSGRERRIQVRERVEITPPRDAHGDYCVDSLWFGGTDNPDVVGVHSLTPTPS